MPRTDTTPAQLHAREAWRMVVRPDNPMPPWAALDYVQDVTDDRREAFVLLCRASMEGIREEADRIFGWTISTQRGGVRNIIQRTEAGSLVELQDWLRFANPGPTDKFGKLGTYLQPIYELLKSIESVLEPKERYATS